jgi:Carbohydrate binding module (family 6)
MRKIKFVNLLFAALCCLLMSSQAQAQQAFGYTAITFNPSTNTATGYASTEVDYETAYYYDAEVQARIENENGTVLGSGGTIGNPSASIFFDVINLVFCFRITIISFVIVRPHFLGCDGDLFDAFGFSDFWWGWFWDFGDFSLSRRNRCILTRLIFIATIVRELINCLPAEVRCDKDTNQLLPSGLSATRDTPFLTDLQPGIHDSDHVTIRCHAENPVTNEPQSGVVLRFRFASTVPFDGGHVNHAGVRPKGSFNPTTARTDSDGNASTVYTAPRFSGTIQIEITADGMTNDPPRANIDVRVPSLQRLQNPAANEGYLLRGSSETGNTFHPDGHFGTSAANEGLRGIASDYRNTGFPQAQFPSGQPEDRKLNYNDQSLVWGGKFDIRSNVGIQPVWDSRGRGAHEEHRVGINCDVRLSDVPNENVIVQGVNINRRQLLEEIFNARGSTNTLREFGLNHWHLRFEFNNLSPVLNGSVPANGTPAAIPGAVEAEMYDTNGNDGTQGSFVPNDGTADPMYNYPQVLAITGEQDQSYVPMAGGQWMKYTVNIVSSGTYSFVTRVASASGGNTFRFEVDGIDRTGSLYIPNTGSGDLYQFVAMDDIWLDAGQHVVRLVVDGTGPAKGNFDYFTINPYFPPQFCDPEWWELDECRNGGGSWDYSICACQYGCIMRACEAY